MRNKLMKKLHSERGASLTFALLLFLVCAAVGSVVLTSATATAGRASGNYDYDQRYYAVTSAAELLRDTLEDKSQTFTYELTKKSYSSQTITTWLDAEGQVLTDSPGAQERVDNDPRQPQYELTVSRAYGSTSEVIFGDGAVAVNDLIGKLALSLVNGKNPQTMFGSYATTNWLAPGTSVLPAQMTLTVTGPTNAGGLTVNVTPTLNPDGSLTLLLQNASEDTSLLYKMELNLQMSVQESAPRTSETLSTYNASTESGSGGKTISYRTNFYVKTETCSATVSWHVADAGKAA